MSHRPSTSLIAAPALALAVAGARVAAATGYFYGYWFSHGLT